MKNNIEKLTKFIDKLVENDTPVTVFLINGVKLQGKIAACHSTDNKFMLLLEREGHGQLVMGHAISTISPLAPVLHEA